MLVDTGVGADSAFLNRAYAPQHFALADALAACGVSEVAALVNSHLHFDHCGNNRAFAGVPTWVQAAELEAARAEHYTVHAWFDFAGAELRAAHGEAELAEGVHLVPTPGHTPGHQSVLVEADAGRALVCAQAAYTLDEWEAGADVVLQAADGLEDLYRDSYARLHALAPAAVYFSHDARTWRPAGS